jgi:ATP-dependent helicase Lhr and Lhr-like helicase
VPGDLVTLSAGDALNLVGILTAGARIASVWKNRILLRDGVPVAGLEEG